MPHIDRFSALGPPRRYVPRLPMLARRTVVTTLRLFPPLSVVVSPRCLCGHAESAHYHGDIHDPCGACRCLGFSPASD